MSKTLRVLAVLGAALIISLYVVSIASAFSVPSDSDYNTPDSDSGDSGDSGNTPVSEDNTPPSDNNWIDPLSANQPSVQPSVTPTPTAIPPPPAIPYQPPPNPPVTLILKILYENPIILAVGAIALVGVVGAGIVLAAPPATTLPLKGGFKSVGQGSSTTGRKVVTPDGQYRPLEPGDMLPPEETELLNQVADLKDQQAAAAEAVNEQEAAEDAARAWLRQESLRSQQVEGVARGEEELARVRGKGRPPPQK